MTVSQPSQVMLGEAICLLTAARVWPRLLAAAAKLPASTTFANNTICPAWIIRRATRARLSI